MKNNRSLADKHMDSLDHALGRPTTPTGETTRNFFGVEIGGDDALAMMRNPHWKHTRDFMGTSGFAVSDEGKAALASYLKDNWTPPKRYDVTWGDHTSNVVADKAGQAKYRAWLRADFSHLSFGDYVKNSTARVAA